MFQLPLVSSFPPEGSPSSSPWMSAKILTLAPDGCGYLFSHPIRLVRVLGMEMKSHVMWGGKNMGEVGAGDGARLFARKNGTTEFHLENLA